MFTQNHKFIHKRSLCSFSSFATSQICLNNLKHSMYKVKSPKQDSHHKISGKYFWSKLRQDQYRAYFQAKYKQLDLNVYQIIQALNSPIPDNSEIAANLEKYLEVKSNTNFLAQPPANKINLLIALQMRSNFPQSLQEKFRKMLIQHILRHQNQNLTLDQYSLVILIKALQKFRQHQSVTLKWNSIKYLAVHLLQINFPNIPLAFYPFVIKLIHTELKSSSLDNFKYMKFIGMLQDKITGILQQILQEQLIADEYKFVMHHQFMMQLVQIYHINGLAKQQYGHTLYTFLINKYFYKKFSNPTIAIINYNVIYRFFSNRLADQHHRNLKLSILQQITLLYEHNPQLSQEIYHSRQSQHLCYSILTHFFHSKFQLLTRQQNGFTVIDSSQHLSPPNLPNIFWKLYQANSSYLNSYPLIRYTIKNCYTDRYIHTPEDYSTITQTSSQSQMNIRVTECLQQLKIQFKSQSLVAGRVIDFVLADNLLLEVDGIFHYEPRSLRTNDSTNFRNLHLVLSGHKLMTISIYEYNICRETEQLVQLISRKLNILKKTACFVM